MTAHPQLWPNHPAPGEAPAALTADDPTMNGPKSTPAQRWLARLSFVLAGLAIVVLVVFAGLKSLAMVAVGLTAAVVSLAAAYLFLSRRSIWRWLSLTVFVLTPIAVIVVYAFRDLLWIALLSAAVWLLAGMTARLAQARAPSAAACPIPVPDHEPEVRRREGREVRPAAQGRRTRRRGVPHWRRRARRCRQGGPRGRRGRRRPARRRRRRRNAGPRGRDRGRARHPVRRHQRGYAQSLRPRPGAGSRGPFRLSGCFVRWSRVAGRPRDDRRPDVRQQRVVRRVRGGGRDPCLPRRQAEYDPEYAS